MSSASPTPFRCRPASRFVGIGALYLVVAKQALSEDHLAAKWQDYQEEGGRIRVISRYLGVEKAITPMATLRAHAVHDAISGATPTGAPSDDRQDVKLSPLTDTREAAVVDLDLVHDIHKWTIQYSHSDEHDFLSRGYALSQTSEFNRRNTGVTAGASFTDDEVRPTFFDASRFKATWDFFAGLTQVVDPNTVVAVNLTYSEIDGYLSDPYKLVQKRVEVLPELFLDITFPENRPENRIRRIVHTDVKRFFPQANASVELDLRYFDDSWGVESKTVGVEWYQKIGYNWIVRPKLRYYRQSAARFYSFDLDAVDVEPVDRPSGSDPSYSSDYRLAEFQTITFGVKAVYKATERLSFDASFERYEMKGRDGVTPQSAFPAANIVTLGGSWWF